MMTLGLSDSDRNQAAMICGICMKVIHQPRIDAEAMIRNTIPVICEVRISIWTMSSTLSAR